MQIFRYRHFVTDETDLLNYYYTVDINQSPTSTLSILHNNIDISSPVLSSIRVTTS